MSVVVKSVEKRSPASRAGIKDGDVLISINGNVIMDVLDYRFYQNESRLILQYIDKKGKIKTKNLKKRNMRNWGFVLIPI